MLWPRDCDLGAGAGAPEGATTVADLSVILPSALRAISSLAECCGDCWPSARCSDLGARAGAVGGESDCEGLSTSSVRAGSDGGPFLARPRELALLLAANG